MSIDQGSATRDLEALQVLTRDMVTSRNPSAVLGRLSLALARRIEFTRVSILLFDLENGVARVITASDRGEGDAPIYLQVSKYPELNRLIQTRNTVVINDALRDPMLDVVRADVSRAGVGATVLFPLLFEGNLVGAIFLRRPPGQPPPDADSLRFGEIVAATCATALHTSRSLQRARHRQAQATRARMLAESKLKNAAHFEELFEYASEGMAVIDPGGEIVSINQEGARMLGFEREDLRGRALEGIVVSGDQVTLNRMIAGFDLSIYPRNLTLRVHTAKREERTISLSSGGLGGQSKGVILSFRDVTESVMLQRELTATKDFLENLIDQSVSGIVACRMDGVVILFNRSAEEMTERSLRDGANTLQLGDLIDDMSYAELLKRLRSDDHGGRGILAPSTLALRNRSGDKVPVRATASLLTEDGQETAIVALFEDLRGELQLRGELEVHAAQAAEMQGALLMASTAAHELNQPLTAIIGFAEMAQSALEEDHRARRSVDRVVAAAERLAQRVRDLGRLKRVVTRSYGDGAEIVDIEASTRTVLPGQAFTLLEEATNPFDDPLGITDNLDSADGDR
jgi:PAS domain S-box-containing protein